MHSRSAVCFDRIQNATLPLDNELTKRDKRFTVLSLTSIIFHPVCQLQCARPRWKNDLWQWPEARREFCSRAPAIRNVCVPGSGTGSGMCSFTLSAESKSFLCMSVCVCLFCTAVMSLSTAWRHSGTPRSAPLLSPWLSGRKVLMAAAIPESLSICCGWHPSFTVTSPVWQHWQECHAISVSPSKPAPDGCHFSTRLMNDLCCGRCESLHSNQSPLKYVGLFGSLTSYNKKDYIYPRTHVHTDTKE